MFRTLLLSCLLGLLFLPLYAQVLDPAFQPTELRSAASGLVRTLAVQPDGKIIVVGNYDFVGSNRVGKVCRLQANGSPDLTFNPGGAGANGLVQVVLLQPDGKILIAGDFSAYNGVPAPAVARLNPDGTPDPSFAAQGLGLLRSVYSLALQPNGRILAGGFGQVASGAAPDIVVRLNANGTRDPTFALPTQLQLCPYCTPYVYALLVQPSGKIVIGGSFVGFSNPFGTGPVNNIIRLNSDGSPDTSFAPNAGVQGFNERYVFCLAQQADGKLLVGGYFNRYGLTTTTPVTGCLMRLEIDGALDPTFSAGNLGSNRYSSVSTVLPLASGSLLVGGYFSQVGGVARGGLARVFSSGALDAGFAAGPGSDAAITVAAVAANGQLVLGGSFTQYDGVACNGVAQVLGNGALDPAFVPPTLAVRGTMEVAIPLINGQLLVSGRFTAMNGTPTPAGSGPTLRVNANGSFDTTFSSPTSRYLRSPQANGNYYLTTSGFPNSTATLSRYSAIGTAVGFIPQVNWGVFGVLGVTEQPDGKLLVYGSRQYVMGGNNGPLLYRFLANGALDTSFSPLHTQGPGYINWFESVFVQPDGKIIAFQNDSYKRLESNGTPDNSFTSGVFDAIRDTLTGKVMQPNGQMLISGSFSQFNGFSAPFGILRLLPTGGLDPTFSGVTTRYTVKSVQPDGRILVTSGRGVNTVLLRLEPDGRRDLSFGPVAVPLDVSNTYYGPHLNVALQPLDGKIILCGGFRTVAGQFREGLARLTNPGVLSIHAAAAGSPLVLYPNPAQEQVTVQLPASGAPYQAKLFDLTGRLVKSWPLLMRQPEATLNVHAVTDGMYLLRLSTDFEVYQQKVAIRH